MADLRGFWKGSSPKNQKKAAIRQWRRKKTKRIARSLNGSNGQAFYLSPEWRQLRYKVLKKNQGRCQCCGSTAADGKKMHVDHIKPRSKFPKLSLCEENMQLLCEDCNLGKGAWDDTDWRIEAQCSPITDSVNEDLDRQFREHMKRSP